MSSQVSPKTVTVEPVRAAVEDAKPAVVTSSAPVEPPVVETISEPVAAEPDTKTTAEPAAESAAKPESAKEGGAENPPTPTRRSVSFDKAAKTHDGSPLSKFFSELPSVFEATEWREMWGIELQESETHVQTSIVLEKFLRANNKDVAKSKAQLIEALKWRKKTQPGKLLDDKSFDNAKFGKLGYVTTHTTASGAKEVITWNIYGAVKSVKNTFSDIAEFLEWRAALMELSIRKLDLASATEKIPENGPDPYRMIQVHDYRNVSFLRMDPSIKAASKETIQTFSMAYPELLKEKFFVNVPVLMGWVFTAMKIFLSAETIKKFHPLSYGSSLAGEIPEIAEQLPKDYGGNGQDLKEGTTVMYTAE
ncbi:phosphatidylinositol transfer sfh5 protein [Rutstroemia sp. NJR-2017a WRK4]|nr:phosphatidylinositol transfer sfh5 protein [Rutstroemia sp. NJR-2017a WRK4]